LPNSGELAGKVGAKHSDRKSTVSAIGYARMFSHLCGTLKPLLIKLFRIGNVPLVNQKRYIFHIYSANPREFGERRRRFLENNKGFSGHSSF